MALTTTAFAPDYAAQSAALTTFLASANHTLTVPRASAICASLALTADSDFKEKATLLRAELLEQGIRLGQSHALEALSRMVGFTSYMRAKEAMKQQAGDFAREGFLLRVHVTGDEEPKLFPYASLPKAANALIEQIMAQLTLPGEPVFCELRRSPQSVVIEVCRAKGVWFTVGLLPYVGGPDKLDFVEFDAESQRTFFERVLRALERGRPGTLALYGVIPQMLTPWHYASFNLTFGGSGVQKFLPNELELFFVFESLGLRTAEIVGSEVQLLGSEGSATLTMAWNRYDGELPALKADISAVLLQSLVDRYRHWRSGLSVSINDAVMLVTTGSTNTNGSHLINTQVLTSEREKQGLSLKALADMAGITEQNLQRIEKYGFAPEQLIPVLAQALSIDANALVDKPDGQLGFAISEAQHLLNSMKDVHHYGTSFPDDLDKKTEAFIKESAEGLHELCDLVQMQDGVFAESLQLEPIKKEHLLEHAQQLLDNIQDEGLMLIVARGVDFSKGNGPLSGVEGFPLHTVTFRFQPAASAASPAVRG